MDLGVFPVDQFPVHPDFVGFVEWHNQLPE
jgi:hypothetical protein